jgi:vitamin B12 transport system ATP-binding protein
MITVSNLSVLHRFSPISFTLQPGEKLHLLGPNGSGKSSLLAGLAGVLPVTTGNVNIAGKRILEQDLSTQSIYRAYLSQDGRPSFHIQVYQYLMLSRLESLHYDEAEFERAVKLLVLQLSLGDKLNKSILHLSGGEWQRVRLAGICLQIWPTLNPTAKLLLLDEPTAALDIGQEKMLYNLVEDLSQLGISVVMANHELNRSLHYADKALLLDKGKLIQFGPVNEVLKAETVSQVFDTEVSSIKLNGRTHLIFD